MEPGCRRIVSTILPAVRASVAEVLSKDYAYKQEDIAKRLGIVQVAISKYANGRYSNEVARIKEHILKDNMCRGIVASITSNKTQAEVGDEIDRLCARLYAEPQ